MHKWAEQIMKCVKTKVDGMGIDNIDLKDLEELELWTRIAKNITCYDKDYKIVEAMEENPETDYSVNKYGELRYYDHKMPNYKMDKDTYRENSAMELRDMDRKSHKVMYYTEMGNSEYDRFVKEFKEKHDRESFEKWLNLFISDMTEQSGNLTPELRTIAKTRLQNGLLSQI